MAKNLIFAEQSGGKLKTVAFEILGKLHSHENIVLALNTLSDEDKAELTKYGANKIIVAKSDALNNYSTETYTNALKEVIDAEKVDYVFSGATSVGKDLFPRLSGEYNAGLASDVVEVEFSGDDFSGTKPLFAGKCLATVKLNGPKPHFVTVRPNALGLPENPAAGSGSVSDIDLAAQSGKATVKEVIKGTSEKADLTEANIIVSGGRAMKNKDNFKILDELADLIGATVGASRAAVDSGYADHAMQVGQTGKTVSPSLYIACGISGSIQHLAGMRTSKIIVAVNTDPDAPIFSKSDYGIVGDLFQIVPLLTEEIKKRR